MDLEFDPQTHSSYHRSEGRALRASVGFWKLSAFQFDININNYWEYKALEGVVMASPHQGTCHPSSGQMARTQALQVEPTTVW